MPAKVFKVTLGFPLRFSHIYPQILWITHNAVGFNRIKIVSQWQKGAFFHGSVGNLG